MRSTRILMQAQAVMLLLGFGCLAAFFVTGRVLWLTVGFGWIAGQGIVNIIVQARQIARFRLQESEALEHAVREARWAERKRVFDTLRDSIESGEHPMTWANRYGEWCAAEAVGEGWEVQVVKGD